MSALAEAAEAVRQGALRHPLALAGYLRGRRQRARGRAERAVAALERARRRDPAVPAYGLHLGLALLDLKRREGAAEVAAGLAEQRRAGLPDPDRLAAAALIQATLGDVGAARGLAIAAVQAGGAGWPGRRVAALALERAGEPTRALELAEAPEQRARLAGQLRALDPTWAPELPSRPMACRDARVLYLLESSLPHAPSGYGYRSLELLRALREAGFDPVAATRLGFPASRGITGWAPVEEVDGVEHHRFNIPGVRQYSGIPLDDRLQQNAELLLELVERVEPRVIIAATPHLNGVTALALRAATGAPIVYDVRGFPEKTWAVQPGGADSEAYRLRRAAETRCAAEADGVIVPSETMQTELVERGLDPGRISIVPQVVDLATYAPRPRPDQLARAYGLDTEFVAGCVSSLQDYEGIDVLLRAVALVRGEGLDLGALVVGDGPVRASLHSLAAELEIADAVAFAGRVDREAAPDHYALLDAFALPRRDLEVCRAVTPLKPFEALATGVPLIASDLPALAEVVTASGGGLLVLPESPQALAGALAKLAEEPAEREALGASGREYMLAGHDRPAAADALRATLPRP
jgi:glycosyltransferase involved in cell wall biosynthesis